MTAYEDRIQSLIQCTLQIRLYNKFRYRVWKVLTPTLHAINHYPISNLKLIAACLPEFNPHGGSITMSTLWSEDIYLQIILDMNNIF